MNPVVQEACHRLYRNRDYQAVITELIGQATDDLTGTNPLDVDALRTSALRLQSLNTLRLTVEEHAELHETRKTGT